MHRGFRLIPVLVALLVPLALCVPTSAQDPSPAPAQMYGGQILLGPDPLPAHVQLQRKDGTTTGTITIPFGDFELVDMAGDDIITGRFAGDGGSGGLVLRLDGDVLSGEFDLGGQPGTITARAIAEDAATFFSPPEQQLDLTTAQWLEDLDRLADILTSEHASPYHRITEADFAAEVARVRAAIPDLDGIGAAFELRKLAALIGDGHTTLALPATSRRLPLEFYIFPDGPRVVAASVEYADLLGARLAAIGNVPADSVSDRLRALIAQGETENHHRALLPGLLANPDALAAVGLDRDETVSLTFDVDGTEHKVNIAPTDTAELLPLGTGPLFRRNGDQGFSSQWLADDTLYVNWRSYEGLADHATALMAALDEKPPARLIVDLRDNAGGDFNAGRAFIEALKGHAEIDRPGGLYILIGRKTFSAAMTNALDFRNLTQAVLVGEPAGAAPNNWQEVRRFTLPNSNLRVGVSTEFYEFLPGEAELTPDHVVEPILADWTSGEDAAIRFVLAQPAP